MNTTTEASVSEPIADLESDSLIGDFDEGKRLIGTRCDECGRTMIGSRVVCSGCVGRRVSRLALPSTGILYSYTRLHPGAGEVRPLGYVDLDGVEVRTLADLFEDGTPLRVDAPVRLVVEDDRWYFTTSADA
ncbi:OB-fold domain-containing protein [Leucobacter weissii]|uniref:OB-fold domain-containing protein n=1 Tax=Leucobacter weissii TaxID=1983706 RepID=A0A939MJE1_9MICO|nr:OB-fold domain-containing protein [Leucobacter weissii]MBO1901340.1 OB-fold domain-containing protein [Leucobacter weissii]